MSSYPLIKKMTIIALWAGFSFVFSSFLADDLEIKRGLFILLVCAGLWMSEIIPLPVTALIVPVLAYFFKILTPAAAMAPFSNTIIFLFMGGFTLAALLNRYNIDLWLADRVIRLAGGNLWLSIIGFYGVTSILSMFISNTATTAMMVPIAVSLIDKQFPRMRTMLLLGTAYAANIGGNGTVVGSPPNAIAAAALELTFFDWFKVGFPTLIFMFPLVIISLWFVIKPEKDAYVNKIDNTAFEWSARSKGAVCLFLFTVICWIFSSQISSYIGLKKFDHMIAIFITAMAPALGLISWKELEKKIGWGILIIFGGGLCLSSILGSTGTTAWIASSIFNSISNAPLWTILIVSVAMMVFLTEISSNTGSAAILVPVMFALSDQFNPAFAFAMVFGIGLAANCAFMLPIATPPNALVYGTGFIEQKQMLKTGMVLNLCSIVVIFILVSILL
ncbi:MAG: Anion transporter [Candidatus Marinimicrobia bacterium]|jgi:sodium-dependent dicarboxylate transporter 2/3/5|nr:Anion transporter [Candidatus Neomarinimicrobiota bacterium]|tara:strand:+ start:3404 stop:4744 length:1341 start_codon:yes stop_codon:yes gene_type:complete